MPKIVKYPRLKIVSRRSAAGKVITHYYYDLRSEGGTYQHLGKDHTEALRQWRELHLDAPQKAGKIQEAIAAFEQKALPEYDNAETRKSYAKQLRRIAAVFGHMRWEDVALPDLTSYLEQRSAKVQANREMAAFRLAWNYALKRGLTRLPWPASGVKSWKNKETARKYKPSEDVFAAIYAAACATLRDAMDIAACTGMRLTDVRTVLLPSEQAAMAIEASKTGKAAKYNTEASKVLPPLIERRRALFAAHDYLLSTPDGRALSERMLFDRFAKARTTAASQADAAGRAELAKRIKKMIPRDCRKIAANRAESIDAARILMQHTSESTTRAHYWHKPEEIKVVG